MAYLDEALKLDVRSVMASVMKGGKRSAYSTTISCQTGQVICRELRDSPDRVATDHHGELAGKCRRSGIGWYPLELPRMGRSRGGADGPSDRHARQSRRLFVAGQLSRNEAIGGGALSGARWRPVSIPRGDRPEIPAGPWQTRSRFATLL